MTDDATLSAGLREIKRSLEDFVEADACDLLLRAAKRIEEMHEEILHLRIYAPGHRHPHVVTPIKRIGPTDAARYGIKLETEEEFAAWGNPVPNEAEA